MLCAFFGKRLRGLDSESVLDALFAPFWTSTSKLKPRRRTSPNPAWVVRPEWRERAARDGTTNALALLEFRINRLCKLISVCDCWPTSVGKHLAHWIDSHVHLALIVEEGKVPLTADAVSGESRPGSSALTLTDWRHVADEHTLGIREALCVRQIPQKTATPCGVFYSKLVGNLAICKTLGETIGNFADTPEREEMICAAVARCLLGYDAHKADFGLRLAVHRSLSEGTGEVCRKIIARAADGGAMTVFASLREFVVRVAVDDGTLFEHVKKKTKWPVYAANALYVAETIRVNCRSKDVVYSRMEDALRADKEEERLLLRNCKKVPGIVSRNTKGKRERLCLVDVLKTLAIESNRESTSKNTLGDGMINAGGGVFPILADSRCRDGRVGYERIRGLLARAKAESTFVEIARFVATGALVDIRELARTSVLEGRRFGREMGAVCDALELIHHNNRVRSYALPKSVGDAQREAAKRYFKDKSCDDAEIFRRRGELVWCSGCRKVKNFVITSKSNEEQCHSTSGYKRICHESGDIYCDEKRTYPCCKNVPLRRSSVMDASGSRCVEIFGQAYVVTTCCGRLATLECVSTTAEEIFSCAKCTRDTVIKRQSSHAKTCRFCNEIVPKQKGSFTGLFAEGDGTVRMHTFCKRHSRSFMRREFEPMDLEKIMAEIPKTMKM